MALDIVKLYISLLSEFFIFSDMAVMTPPAAGGDGTPPLIPGHSNILTTGHYLMRILGEIQECVNEVNAMEVSNDTATSLKGLLESARWKFVDILVMGWLRGGFSFFHDPYRQSLKGLRFFSDANIFYHLETWTTSLSEPYTTVYLSDIQLFQKHVTTYSFKLAGGVDLSSSASASSSRMVKQYPIPSEFVAKITKAFLDTLYAFLDGLVHLASDELPVSVDKPVQAPGDTVVHSMSNLDLSDVVSAFIVAVGLGRIRLLRLIPPDVLGYADDFGRVEYRVPQTGTNPKHAQRAGDCIQRVRGS